MSRRAAVLATSVLCLAACDLGTDFADEMVEQTAERNRRRLIEQQRAELPLPDPEVVPYLSSTDQEIELDEDFRVELIDDLVVGEGRREPEYLFVTFSGGSAALGNVAADSAGRIFVLETRSDTVRVFDRNGEFLRQFGQPGQGPTDFQSPFGIEVAGDRVYVYHRRSQVSIWSPEGEFIRDRQIFPAPEAMAAEQLLDGAEGGMSSSRSEAEQRAAAGVARAPIRVIGRADGSMMMIFRRQPQEPSGRITTRFLRVLSHFEDGIEQQSFFEAPQWSMPSYAVAPDGRMYVGMFGHLSTEHYIVALDPEGEPRWVLVTPWDEEVPPAAGLRVDPEGRLFVFPNFRVEAEDSRSPVQVYTGDGELIGSGYVDRRPIWTNWQRTVGDGIYGVRLDPNTEAGVEALADVLSRL